MAIKDGAIDRRLFVDEEKQNIIKDMVCYVFSIEFVYANESKGLESGFPYYCYPER